MGRPWASIPPELAAQVRHGLADEMMEEIHRRIPEYARRWDDAFATVIRSAIDRVIDEVLMRVTDGEDGERPTERTRRGGAMWRLR
ncbi:MAG: hypothetical protein ACJ72W_10610 [Actinoallomurus sp.]